MQSFGFPDGNEKESSRKTAFLELLDGHDFKASGHLLHFRSVKEMNDEASDLIHIFSAMNASPVVGVLLRPDCEYVQSSRNKNSPDLRGKSDQLRRGECHAIEHMGVDGIEAGGFERQWSADIVD